MDLNSILGPLSKDKDTRNLILIALAVIAFSYFKKMPGLNFGGFARDNDEPEGRQQRKRRY